MIQGDYKERKKNVNYEWYLSRDWPAIGYASTTGSPSKNVIDHKKESVVSAIVRVL
jgi:hypothetical protein